MACYFSLLPIIFGSIWQLLLLSPIMLVVMPVLAPILSILNAAVSPDVPLVFWR